MFNNLTQTKFNHELVLLAFPNLLGLVHSTVHLIKNALNSEHFVGVTKMGLRYFYIFAYVKHYYQQVKFGRTYFFLKPS